MNPKQKLVFGGVDQEWKASDWTASDDRVRGGKSQSYMTCSGSTAQFHGNLDIKTLGAAGFASQRTTGDDREWDLSSYGGIELLIVKADEKRYTFILKDELLAPDPETGREQSTISYEFDFQVPRGPRTSPILVPWTHLKATYRGRESKDARPINLAKVRRMSLMMRSFFGTQEGDFSMIISSIAAVCLERPTSTSLPVGEEQDTSPPIRTSTSASEHGGEKKPSDPHQAWRVKDCVLWLIERCWKSLT